MIDVNKSVHEQVIYQSDTERTFAEQLEKDGSERLYFVVKTKSSLFTGDLRDKESAKIKCGRAHFKALTVGKIPHIMKWPVP